MIPRCCDATSQSGGRGGEGGLRGGGDIIGFIVLNYAMGSRDA